MSPRLLIPVCALLFLVLAWSSANRKSLTWDEPTFITSGYTYLDRGDFRLNPEAPPLLQEWVALPVWFGDFAPPDYAHPAWESRSQVPFARDHVNRNAGRIEAFAWNARAPVWLLGAALVLVGGTFCLRIAGATAGVVFAGLVALSPNLLAHGRLATTDFGCAALMFGAVACLWRAVDHDRPIDWVLLGGVTGLALLAKYTALLLVPAFLIIAFWEWRAGRRGPASFARGGAIVSIVVLALLFVGYDFGFGPALYLRGLDAVYSRSVEGFRFYLLGEVLDEPVWYYHLVAFLLKTPEPTVLLLGIAVVAVVRTPAIRRPAIYFAVPALLVVAASCFDQANLGLRRILPAYPFVFALVAVAGSQKPCRVCRVVYAGLVLWAALASALAYPHYLSYFNVLSGGTANGPYLLEDSNVDWGQDLPALAEWQSLNPGPIALRYFGTVEPVHYGVHARRMTDAEVIAPGRGVYAVSAHTLVHFRKIARRTGRADIDWLDRYEPFHRAGGSIYLYRFP